MARFRMSDSTIVDTDKATNQWEEARDFDGSNHISRATGSQWGHETLYRSLKGRYYTVLSSDYQGSLDHAEYVSNEQAAAWLLLMEAELPQELGEAAAKVTE